MKQPRTSSSLRRPRPTGWLLNNKADWSYEHSNLQILCQKWHNFIRTATVDKNETLTRLQTFLSRARSPTIWIWIEKSRKPLGCTVCSRSFVKSIHVACLLQSWQFYSRTKKRTGITWSNCKHNWKFRMVQLKLPGPRVIKVRIGKQKFTLFTNNQRFTVVSFAVVEH